MGLTAAVADALSAKASDLVSGRSPPALAVGKRLCVCIGADDGLLVSVARPSLLVSAWHGAVNQPRADTTVHFDRPSTLLRALSNSHEVPKLLFGHNIWVEGVPFWLVQLKDVVAPGATDPQIFEEAWKQMRHDMLLTVRASLTPATHNAITNTEPRSIALDSANPCQACAVDSDSCLQRTPGWNAMHTCQSSKKWCDTWDRDMQRCCPDTCGNMTCTMRDCNALRGRGHCIFPNDAVRKAAAEYSPKYKKACAVNSNQCLQSSPNWGPEFDCESSEHWCSLWKKDLWRCCPDTCRNSVCSKDDCHNLDGYGTCSFPNSAMKTNRTSAHQPDLQQDLQPSFVLTPSEGSGIRNPLQQLSRLFDGKAMTAPAAVQEHPSLGVVAMLFAVAFFVACKRSRRTRQYQYYIGAQCDAEALSSDDDGAGLYLWSGVSR